MLESKKIRIVFTLFLLIVFFTFLYFFNTQDRFIYNQQGSLSYINFEKAMIIRVISESLEDSKIKGLYRGNQELEIKILSGAHKGEIHTIKNYLSDRFNVFGKKGMKIIVSVDTAAPGDYRIAVNNHYRTPVLYSIILLFFLCLWLIGGRKGLKSIIGLVFTFICIVFLFIPMLLKGSSPVFASILTAVLTTIVSIFCINGWSAKAFSAIMGTTLGIIIAGIVSSIFGLLAHISGLNTDEAETLLVIASSTGMQVSELLFAGILIASLGAVMDVAISIAASVYEVYLTDKKLPKKMLFATGMNVGRDITGSMANTLILAFTGTSINTLILIYAYNVNYNQLMNMDIIGIEIIQGMAGSIAMILTVPAVSFISSRLFPVFGEKNKKQPALAKFHFNLF